MNDIAMKALAYVPTLFADRGEMLREMGGGFRGDRAKVSGTDIAMVVLAGAAVVAFFWLLTRFVAWREGRGIYHNPKQLFQRLVRAHRLGLRERLLLTQAARYLRIPMPASLFLRPDLFEVAAAHAQLAGRAAELEALKQKLFAPR